MNRIAHPDLPEHEKVRITMSLYDTVTGLAWQHTHRIVRRPKRQIPAARSFQHHQAAGADSDLRDRTSIRPRPWLRIRLTVLRALPSIRNQLLRHRRLGINPRAITKTGQSDNEG